MKKNELGALRKRCAARLRELDLPTPLDIEALRRAVAAKRGRTIELVTIAGLQHAYGLWVAYPTYDAIFYSADTSPVHRQHIIAHELSHLICGHRPFSLSEGEYLQLLCPDLLPNAFRQVLLRAAYDAVEDREAEVLATLILSQMSDRQPHSVDSRRDHTGELERLSACLEPEQGRLT